MLSPEPAKGAGPMQVVVQERVDHDHRRPGGDPSFSGRIGPKKQVGQGHRPDLAADPVDLAERLQKGCAHPLAAIRSPWAWVRTRQPVVDPANEVVLADVAHEQVQRGGGLDQAALPRRAPRQESTLEGAPARSRCPWPCGSGNRQSSSSCAGAGRPGLHRGPT